MQTPWTGMEGPCPFSCLHPGTSAWWWEQDGVEWRGLDHEWSRGRKCLQAPTRRKRGGFKTQSEGGPLDPPKPWCDWARTREPLVGPV